MLFGSIFGFPLSLRMVEEMLAARGICVTYETVRQWGKKFGKAFSDRIRQRAPAHGDKWHMDEVVVSAEQTSCLTPIGTSSIRKYLSFAHSGIFRVGAGG